MACDPTDWWLCQLIPWLGFIMKASGAAAQASIHKFYTYGSSIAQNLDYEIHLVRN